MGWWTDLRDTAESAAVIAGNYVLPGSSLITSKLVSDGSKQQLNSDLGTLAQLASGGAGAWEGNLANYQTAANSILGSVSPGTTVESLSKATGLSGAQLAKLGITAASLLAGGNAIANSTGGTGGLGLTQQDRSGVSSGSANYTPEYYQAIQEKYNQYMPQQKGKDITADLKNWYETKYSPAATQSPSAFTQAQINQPANINNYIAQQKAIDPSAFTTSEQYAAAMDKYGVSPASLARALNIPEWQVQLEYNRIDPNGKYAATASNLIPQVVSGMQAAGKTNADIAALMDQYKTTPAQVASALGMTTQEVQNLYNTAKPTGLFSTVTQAAPTVAAAIPATQPSYTALTSSSSPAAIAAAYADFVNSSGGDTAFNREAAINYLTNLGVSNDTIGQAYGLFKG